MPKITGKGTPQELFEQVGSLDLGLNLPEAPSFEVDPLPSLAEGEGIQPGLSMFERTKLGVQVGGGTYNTVMDYMHPTEDMIPDPTFKFEDNLDAFTGMQEDDYAYMKEAVNQTDLLARRDKIVAEKEQMQRVMQDGSISGMAYVLAGSTILDPVFWAGMAIEGPAVLGIAGKSARAAAFMAKTGISRPVSAGLVAGGVAVAETALLAQSKATVDAEDVLYAGLGGMLLGTGAAKLASKLKGDDFYHAANDIQHNFATTAMNDMDEALVQGTMHKPLRETDSVFGVHDPDNLAELRAERVAADAQGSTITGEAVPDEAKGYADAFMQNVNEMHKTGVFNKLMQSKTLQTLAKNPAMSDFMTMFTSKSNAVKSIAVNLLEDASGATGRRKTAAIMHQMESRKLLEGVMPAMRSSFQEFARVNKVSVLSEAFSGTAKTEHFRLIRMELEKYRNASIKGVKYISDQPKYIQDAVDAWRKGMDDAAELAKTSGVRGFDDFRVHDGYVPLLWVGRKIAAMPKPLLDKYKGMLAKGYLNAGFDDKSAKQIASAVLNRKTKQALGMDTNPGALLSKDSREFLREMLLNNDMSEKEINSLFGRIDVTLADRGKSARARSRMPIDLTVQDGEHALIDLVDNDLSSVGTKYFTEMSGRSSLARKGIRHDGAFRAIKTAALKDALDSGHTQAEVLKYGEVLDSVYNQFLGKPVGEGINRGARRMMEWAMTSMLGTVGAAQMTESANVIAAHGISNIMKYAPDVKMYRAAIKAGKGDLGLLGELQAHMGGLWDEHLFLRPDVRLDQTAGESGAMLSAVDNTLAVAKDKLGYISGMNQVKNFQQQITAISQANKVIKMIKGGKDQPKLMARFKDVGWDEGTIASLKSKIDDGTITFQANGAIDKLNLEKWDAKTYEDFAVGMHRHSAQIIQFPLIGETATWQHKTFGAIMSQFRSFGILALEKQTARNIRMADQETAMLFPLSLGFSALIYMAKAHATSIGRPDSDEYLEKRLAPVAIFNGALMWSGAFSLTSEGLNAASAVGLLPQDWGTGAVGRAGGGGGAPAFSFDRQVPAASVIISGMKASTGLMTSLSPFSDNTLGNQETDSVFRALPLGNTVPAMLLKNALHNIPEED